MKLDHSDLAYMKVLIQRPKAWLETSRGHYFNDNDLQIDWTDYPCFQADGVGIAMLNQKIAYLFLKGRLTKKDS